MERQFSNINQLLDFVSCCPLCRSKKLFYDPTPQFDGKITISLEHGSKLILRAEDHQLIMDIYTNRCDFIGNIDNVDDSFLFCVLCRKYHFFTCAKIELNKTESRIKNISLHKTHFIRQINDQHFVVNANYHSNSTNIRITGDSYLTNNIELPLLEFDLSSKKTIDKTLQKILLLK